MGISLPSLNAFGHNRAREKLRRRPQLVELIGFARDGDAVVAHYMDRLARNLKDLRAVVRTQTGKGMRVEFLNKDLVFTGEDPPRATLMVMGAFAEFERSLIGDRQREGIALAKQRGAYTGRKRTLGPEQMTELVARAAAGTPKSELARQYGLSRETVCQYLRRHAAATAEPHGALANAVEGVDLRCQNTALYRPITPGQSSRICWRRFVGPASCG